MWCKFRFHAGDVGSQIAVCLDGHIIIRQTSDDLGKNLCIQSNHSFFKDRSFRHRFDAKLHVICRQTNLQSTGVDQDTFQDGHGGSDRNSLLYGIDCF